MMTAHETPQVYVACLAAYNAGHLHGEWVDATDEDEIQETIEKVLESSPIPNAEEHAFHDYSGFGSMGLGEYSSVEEIAALGALVEEHGVALVVGLKANNVGGADNIREMLTDKRVGVYDELADYAYAMHECTEIPEAVRPYIDWEQMGEDMLTNGAYIVIEVNGQKHIFANY